MSEIPLRECGEFEDDGETPILRRSMTAGEIVERQELNWANTAPVLRARVVAELAKANGR